MRANSIICMTFILVIFMTLFTYSNASAHSPSACNAGSEGSGWRVRCTSTAGHLGQAVTNYSYAPNLAQKYKDATSTGVSRWNNTGIVRFSYSASSTNVINQYDDRSSNANAYATAYTYNNHKTRWFIYYNHAHMNSRSASANAATAAHELGHSIGLMDLTNSSNSNKLMFGSATRSVTTPQAADRTGAREGVK